MSARLPVWSAFADLFLDTETQLFTYRFIERAMRKQIANPKEPAMLDYIERDWGKIESLLESVP